MRVYARLVATAATTTKEKKKYTVNFNLSCRLAISRVSPPCHSLLLLRAPTVMGAFQSADARTAPRETVAISPRLSSEPRSLIVTVRSPPHFLEEWKAAALAAHDNIAESPDHRTQRDELLKRIAEYKVTMDARITELKQYILLQHEEERLRRRARSAPILVARGLNQESAQYALEHDIEPAGARDEDEDEEETSDSDIDSNGHEPDTDTDTDRILYTFEYIPESPQTRADTMQRLVDIFADNPRHGLLHIAVPESADVCRLSWQTIRALNAILRTMRLKRAADTGNLCAVHAVFDTLLTKAAAVTTNTSASCWLIYQPWHEISPSNTVRAWNGQPLADHHYQRQFWTIVKQAQLDDDGPDDADSPPVEQLPVDTFDTSDAYYCNCSRLAYREVAVHQMRVKNWFAIRCGLRDLADALADDIDTLGYATTLRILCKAIELFCDRASSRRWGLQIFASC